MKIFFDVKKEEVSLSKIFVIINGIDARIRFDLDESRITVVSSNDETIEKVFDVVRKYFTIVALEIDNLPEDYDLNAKMGKASHKTTKTVPEKDEKDLVEQSTCKSGKEEMLLNEAIGFALEKLDKRKPINEQVIQFLDDIGMEKSQKVINAFMVALNIEGKITYETVINELHKSDPKVDAKIFKECLKKAFDKWKISYPEIAKSPRLSINSIIKVFFKKMK